MNQDQRKFLISKVEKTCDNQIDELEEQIPDKPSLNNYLIAAFLDNTIQFADIDALKLKMRKAVLKYGHEDRLVKGPDRYSIEDEDKQIVQVDPEDLFIIPNNYLEALSEYEEKKKDIDVKISSLKNIKETIILKLQIGSSITLDKLVMQVDNMGDLNLMNTQLLLEAK